MNDTPETTATSPRPSFRAGDPVMPPGMRALALSVVVLIVLFSVPLYRLFSFAIKSNLYSHIVLIPLISGYLVWLKRPELEDKSPPRRALALLPLGIGAALLAGFGFALWSGTTLHRDDSLALTTASFIFFFAALCVYHLGAKAVRAIAFPLCFLVFMVPIPTMLVELIETFLQHGSAAVAYVFLSAVGTPVFKQDLTFQLEGIRLQVAPECSGIHSSLALFITSLLGGYLFLKSPRNRAILAFAVIPLALLRNGFRVFTIGELCVHIGPHMIDSPIHHHGGPIFFALSLVPFSLLLLWIIRSERRKASA